MQFAARTARMKRNAVRELLKVTANPRIISFAGGLPAPELFPLDEIADAFAQVMSRHGAHAFQYRETEGIAELRDWIAAAATRPGFRVQRQHVAIVSGAQQALDLLGRILIDPGDAIAVENPTYLALLSAWRVYDARFQAVPSDADGPQVDQLESILPPATKLFYLTPNFQNPQGTTLSASRRNTLVRFAQQRGIALIEDDPYGTLRYEGNPSQSLLELDAISGHSVRGDDGPGNVIQVGTFSKVLVPGLRVGWVIAAEPVIEKLVLAKQSADLHTSSLGQHLVAELLQRGALDRQIPKLCAAYRLRRDAMLAALEKYLPAEARWTRPAGGMFLLASLPADMNAQALLAESLRHDVAFVPGEEFHLDGQGKHTIRLNFSNAQPELIEEGIRRLGEAMRTINAG